MKKRIRIIQNRRPANLVMYTTGKITKLPGTVIINLLKIR